MEKSPEVRADDGWIEDKVARAGNGDHPDANLTPEGRAEKDRQLLRKLDLRLIPWLCLIYLLSFLDRTNIGNAKIAGLQEDLHMSNGQWNASLAIFFVSYSVFEPLSNVLLKKFRPRIYIPTIMVLWGIACICQGLVSDFSGLSAVRWFLGLFEAGLFPGCNLYLSCWYRRSEIGARSAIFFSAAAVAGSFGGLLAYALSLMHGVGNKPGWAWIFIIEGLFTVVVAAGSYWLIYDFPDTATFLSPDDRLRVYYRLKADQQSSAEHESFKWAYFWASVKDWKTYTTALMGGGGGAGLYGFSVFLPSILAGLGYRSTTAQLLSIPPYAVAAVLTIAVGWIGDRTKQRGLCAICIAPLSIIGYCVLISDVSVGAKYTATFLAAMGIYPAVPLLASWAANNTEGVYKRGITMGLMMGWSNLQGVVTSNVYRGKDAPRFILGHSVVIGYLTLSYWGGAILHHLLLRRENRLRMAGKRDYLIEGKTPEEIQMLGDKR
ncbi:uncharacterized protein Z520_00601 [Fonsecaea multimorphosa CBS 102226]|uniref:Major facilitator superfamily (MFS) profile domain-containing protein n=1 Tax=Fonsecaea multimorphosa CBS 102226 TaxID=1442371 RepID=A0A0D2L4E4_9EURO|nr:uncharacterized protein Z520_00601 [Fonsecaea multimorphosa CBS 102226]KIY03909.1 hypothetical protein Z520_00601 [Fonsecaea multimorphosa CBS 102226]OAL31750.1 hypothetical protein AYO22_00620 [Fonsecaea multimorphosa]